MSPDILSWWYRLTALFTGRRRLTGREVEASHKEAMEFWANAEDHAMKDAWDRAKPAETALSNIRKRLAVSGAEVVGVEEAWERFRKKWPESTANEKTRPNLEIGFREGFAFGQASQTDGWRDVGEILVKARPIVEIYKRVHGELDDGKEWGEIDNGLGPQTTPMTYREWLGYMQQKIIHLFINAVRLCPTPPQQEEER